MAYTAPTAADLKARFPAFAAVDDAVVDAALAEAGQRVDEGWLEADFATARLLYAAHVLTMDGQGASTETGMAGVKRIKVGPLELERDPGGLTATSYGARFAELERLNFAGPLAL